MRNFTPPNDGMPHPSLSPHCEHAGALPLSLLSDSRPLPPLLVPSNEKAAVAPLYSPSPPLPPPPFRAPSQRGRRRSWVGINTGSSSRRLCAPSAARSSSQPPSPTPRPPPNSDTHNCIPAFSPPFHSNADASATTHNSPNLHIQTHTTASLPSPPFPIQLQHLIRG